jgi:hypothetical protein
MLYGITPKKQTKSLQSEIMPFVEKPTIGKVSKIEIGLNAQQKFFFRYVVFELINERTDKRTPMDKITSRSVYLYRFNVEKDLEHNKYSFPLRIPVHKEASRNDKFICIKWQIKLQAVVTESKNSEDLFSSESSALELEVL